MSRAPSFILLLMILLSVSVFSSACSSSNNSGETTGDNDTDQVETDFIGDTDDEGWPDNCLRLDPSQALTLFGGTEFEAAFPAGAVTEKLTVCYEAVPEADVQIPDGIEVLTPIVGFTPDDLVLQAEFKITWKNLPNLPDDFKVYIAKKGTDKEWDAYEVPAESGTAAISSIRLAKMFLGHPAETPTDGDDDEIDEEENVDEVDEDDDIIDEVDEIEEDEEETPPDLCDPDPCNGHGTCDPADGSCTCNDYFTGDACDACADGTLGDYPDCQDDPCDPDPCNDHGTCDPADGSCTCNDYFTGDACDACADGTVGDYPDCRDNPCDPDPCNDHGTCDTADGSCTCENNYAGDACDSCAPGYVGEYPDCILPTPLPQPGEVIITEFFAYPPDARSVYGEWIEIRNVSDAARRLQLCEIGHGQDAEAESTVIDAAIELAAGQAILLAKTTESLDSGLEIAPEFVWTGWQLDDVADTLWLDCPGTGRDNVRIDEVRYTESWGVLQGYSKQLNLDVLEDPNQDHAVENDKFWNWCDTPDNRTYGYGDHGTPKIDNTSCPDIIEPPENGEVFITEIFADTGFAASNGQWLEIVNATGVTKDLYHCILSSSTEQEMIEDSLQIPPGGILVLGNNADIYSDVTQDYAFSFKFDPIQDTVSLSCYEMTVDEVSYDLAEGWPIATKASLSLVPGGDAQGNDDSANWCYSHEVYYTSSLLFGTPGQANPECGFEPEGTLTTSNDHMYFISAEGSFMTWNDAQDYCRNVWSQSNGEGDLVTLNDLNDTPGGEYNFVKEYYYAPQIRRPLWIGLNDLETEGVFEWSNGETPAIMPTPASNSDAYDCAMQQDSISMAACRVPRKFICEVEGTYVPEITIYDLMDENSLNHQPAGTLVTMGADNNLQVIGVYPDNGALRIKAKNTQEQGIEYAYSFIFFHGFDAVDINTFQVGDILHLKGGVSDNGGYYQISLEPSLFSDSTIEAVSNDPTIDDPVVSIPADETADFLPGGVKYAPYALHTVGMDDVIVASSEHYPYVDLAVPYDGFRLWAFIYAFDRPLAQTIYPHVTGVLVGNHVLPIDETCLADPIIPENICGEGEVIITEFMRRPLSVFGIEGEYVELTNVTDKRCKLVGCELHDSLFTDRHMFSTSGIVGDAESPVIEPNSTYLLARSESNNGFSEPPDYVYGADFELSNVTDQIILTCQIDGSSVEVDRVSYDDSWYLEDAGIALQFDNSLMPWGNNNQQSNWCASTEVFGSPQQFGSPGRRNSSCETAYVVYSIQELQDENDVNHPEPGDLVGIEDAVVVSPIFNVGTSTTRKSVFVMDQYGGEYSGIQIIWNETTYPVSFLQLGQLVRAVGVYMESCEDGEPPNCTPSTIISIEEAANQNLEYYELQTTGGPNPLPQPYVVENPCDIMTGGAMADKLQHVLVKLEGVEITDNTVYSAQGEFTVGTDCNLPVDDYIHHRDPLDNYPKPRVGDQYDLEGILITNFNIFKLAPRTYDDIEMLAIGIQEGELVLTEIFLQSSLYPQTQWFEIYNATHGTGNERVLNLMGCEIVVGDQSMDFEEDFFLEPSDYAVIGNNGDVSANQGACIDYVYTDEDEDDYFYFPVAEDTFYLLCENGREIDSVPFDPVAFPFEGNKSMEVRSSGRNAELNDLSEYWCEARVKFGETFWDGPYGTPGGANDCETTAVEVHSCIPDIWPGDLIITEIMYSPSSVSADNGQWVEIYNRSNEAADLDGCKLVVDGVEHLIQDSGLSLQSQDYVVFANSSDTNANGGFDADFAFGAENLLDLDYYSSHIEFICHDVNLGYDLLIDEVTYSPQSGFPVENPGWAISLKSDSFDDAINDRGISWCDSGEPYGLGDYGTPGFDNVCYVELPGEIMVLGGYTYFISNEDFVKDWFEADSWCKNNMFGGAGDGYLAFVQNRSDILAIAESDLMSTEEYAWVGIHDYYQENTLEYSYAYQAGENWDATVRAQMLNPALGYNSADRDCGTVQKNVSDQFTYSMQDCFTEKRFICQRAGGLPDPVYGDLVISEIMIDPATPTVSDVPYEWLEIHNISDHALNIEDCTISFGSSEVAIDTMSIIDPGEFFVLGQAYTDNGGYTPDFSYGSTLEFSDDSGRIAFKCLGTTLDEVTYNALFPFTEGYAIGLSPDPELHTPQGNDQASSWCTSNNLYGGTPGDINDPANYGTPGQGTYCAP